MVPRIAEVETAALPDPLPDSWVVVDVREQEEWDAGHIDGAVHVPLTEIPRRFVDLHAEGQILVVCKVGARSAQATDFLKSRGLDAVNLAGGMYAWQAAGRHLVAEQDAEPFVA